MGAASQIFIITVWFYKQPVFSKCTCSLNLRCTPTTHSNGVFTCSSAGAYMYTHAVSVTQLMHYNLHWLTCLSALSHHLDSSLPHRYRATVSSCRLCSGLRDGTETSSTLHRWSSARRTV